MKRNLLCSMLAMMIISSAPSLIAEAQTIEENVNTDQNFYAQRGILILKRRRGTIGIRINLKK